MVFMNVRSGLEIIGTNNEYKAKIKELEDALLRLEDFGYSRSVLQVQLSRLKEELRALENTRFQPIEPVTVVNSSLGGHDYYVS
jgi:hypothetical protein